MTLRRRTRWALPTEAKKARAKTCIDELVGSSDGLHYGICGTPRDFIVVGTLDPRKRLCKHETLLVLNKSCITLDGGAEACFRVRLNPIGGGIGLKLREDIFDHSACAHCPLSIS